MKYDFIIIGAGIVGLSTAWQLKKELSRANIMVLEKEKQPAGHQTGHNSGVIHAGVYCEPGSLKERSAKQARKRPTDSVASSASVASEQENSWWRPTMRNGLVKNSVWQEIDQ